MNSIYYSLEKKVIENSLELKEMRLNKRKVGKENIHRNDFSQQKVKFNTMSNESTNIGFPAMAP